MTAPLAHETPVMIEWRCFNKHKHVEIVPFIVGTMLARQHKNMKVFEIDESLIAEAREMLK